MRRSPSPEQRRVPVPRTKCTVGARGCGVFGSDRVRVSEVWGGDAAWDGVGLEGGAGGVIADRAKTLLENITMYLVVD